MIYVGFGFLMVFMKTHCWTSVGFNYLLSAWAFQCGILTCGFWEYVMKGKFKKIPLDVFSLIIGDFTSGACMITFGALLGKCDLFQLWLLLSIETIFYGLNEALAYKKYIVADAGGSMVIHTFGAFYGLAASYFFHNKKAIVEIKKSDGGYTAQVIAMVGTVFLFMFWPSFNAAPVPILSQQRAAVCTALAISASCICAAGVSRLVHHVLNMEIVLNSTVAGGVMVGATCDMLTDPGFAIIIGAVAGIISALGFEYAPKYLRKHLALHDSCGVLFLHGIPGAVGGLISAIGADLAFKAFPTKEAAYVVFPELENGRTPR